MDAKNDAGESLEDTILQDDQKIIDLVDMVSDPDPAPTPTLDYDDDPEYILFSQKQVDESLERAMTRLFSEKFQGIIVETIEKTIKKEIERISPLFQQNVGDPPKKTL